MKCAFVKQRHLLKVLKSQDFSEKEKKKLRHPAVTISNCTHILEERFKKLDFGSKSACEWNFDPLQYSEIISSLRTEQTVSCFSLESLFFWNVRAKETSKVPKLLQTAFYGYCLLQHTAINVHVQIWTEPLIWCLRISKRQNPSQSPGMKDLKNRNVTRNLTSSILYSPYRRLSLLSRTLTRSNNR